MTKRKNTPYSITTENILPMSDRIMRYIYSKQRNTLSHLKKWERDPINPNIFSTVYNFECLAITKDNARYWEDVRDLKLYEEFNLEWDEIEAILDDYIGGA